MKKKGVLNVIENLHGGINDRDDKNMNGTIMLEKIGIARLYWKAAEKHVVNREAIADRNGVYILCCWIDKYSNKYKFDNDNNDHENNNNNNNNNIDTQQKDTKDYLNADVKRCRIMSVYGLTSLIYKDLKSKDLFLEYSSILCLRSFIEYTTGINPKGFSFISLANKCRKSPKLRDHAVDIGLIDIIAIELNDFYEAVIDPNEIYQNDIWTVVSCACEALESMTTRYEIGQNICIKHGHNILNIFSKILNINQQNTSTSGRQDNNITILVPDHVVIHVFECISSICRGNERVKLNWKHVENGPSAVRRWAKQCSSNQCIKGALTNALASTATGYSEDVAEAAMNITLL